MLTKKIGELKVKFSSEIKKTADERELFDVKVKYLGRKGKLTEILKSLKNLSESERKVVGPLANEARFEIEKAIATRKKELSEKIDWEKEKIDITLPGKKQELGHLSPITLVRRDIENIFSMKLNIQHIFFKAHSFTAFAYKLYIGHELHFHFYGTITQTFFAATSIDIK